MSLMKTPPDVIALSYLIHSLPQSLCPVSRPPHPPCACVGESPQQRSQQREDLSQEANPAFVYQRSDYAVGCYLSRRLWSEQDDSAEPPVGDV